MTAARTTPKAFAVWWSQMERWAVSSFHELSWGWPKETVRPLADALARQDVPVDRTRHAEPPLVTLHFTGEMHHRDRSGTKPVKGKLWWAKPGQVIYSKIDVRNGAIGVVPGELDNVAVTSEYPVYAVRPKVADARYVKLLFRTDVFRKKINSLISGASGRKRVQPEDLEAIAVPLPALADQRAIVAAFERGMKRAAKLRAEADALDSAAEADFLKALGLTPPAETTPPKAFAVWWSEMERWGVQTIWDDMHRPHTFDHPDEPLDALCRTGTGGTPDRKRKHYFGGGIPWVKTTEVRNNVITATEETLTQDGYQSSAAKMYPPGSLVMAMYGQGATRGRVSKLGVEATTNQACLVMTEFRDDVAPDYVWHYLMCRYEDIRSLASGNNQPNLSAELLRPFPVPIPPLTTQRRLARDCQRSKAKAVSLREFADSVEQAARDEVEAMILGSQAPAS